MTSQTATVTGPRVERGILDREAEALTAKTGLLSDD